MQMRFERRLAVLQKAASNEQAVVEGKNLAEVEKDAGGSSSFASWMLVLAGLSLPALMAFLNAALLSCRKHAQPCLSDNSGDVNLLER